METKPKEMYLAPSTTVFEVKQEGVICASELTPTYYNPFNDGEDW